LLKEFRFVRTPDEMQIEEIRAFLQVGEFATSGMPRPEHFAEIAQAGYKTVINLALPTSDHALPNQSDLVTRAGMRFVHIPVNFEAPLRRDYELFERILNAIRDEPVFIHCAANMRVSTFVYLYRVRTRLSASDDALSDLHRIWMPNPVWSRFIDSVLSESPAALQTG
jgi:protein tyrosine phosphatase (PTP) superfamily phosphohydrolase (DUF442 family)